MLDFILNWILWTLALYGLIEILKTFYKVFTYTDFNQDGIYFIMAVRNVENKIENFLRSILFRIIYGKEESLENIIIVDLNSTDKTKEILENIEKEYSFVRLIEWNECKELIDNSEQNII